MLHVPWKSASTHAPFIINGPAFPKALTTASGSACGGFDPQGLISTDLMVCLQNSHIGHVGASLHHLDPRFTQASSKHNHTHPLEWILALQPISRVVGLANKHTSFQGTQRLGSGLRPPEASSKLRALIIPAELNYYISSSRHSARRMGGHTPLLAQSCACTSRSTLQLSAGKQGCSWQVGRY